MLSKIKTKVAVQEKKQTSTVTAGLLLDRHLANLDGTSAKIDIPDPKNLLLMYITVRPVDHVWEGGEFRFRLDFSQSFPYEPPKATFLGPTRLWHPNIEGDADRAEWGVCLNILRKDWTPVLGLREIIFGLEMLFLEPNIEDPLPGTAREAAAHLKADPRGFRNKARQWMQGNYCD